RRSSFRKSTRVTRQRRRSAITCSSEIESLGVPPEASALAATIISRKLLPPKAAYDALHVAVAAISGMDYLLTWNCKHIANAAIRDDLEAVIRKAGYKPAVLCTPEELMGGDNDD
ncbi:MAG: hypothetical protein ABI442_11215, partial [Gemmatimonadaceae bacterium]